MPFLIPVADSTLDLTGKLLIIPVVSAANIAQLAVDLLISSASLELCAIFDPSYCIPIAGARDDRNSGITTPLELYASSDKQIYVIQQRSPILKSRKQEFVNALLDFVKQSGVASTLLLTGVSPLDRTDAQMMAPTFNITIPSKGSDLTRTLESLPIPKYSSPVPLPEETAVPFIPGGGLTRRILSSIPSDWPIPTVVLLQFGIDGDNRADANMFAAVTAKVAGIEQRISQWKQPPSWNQGLFGRSHDQTLYG